MGPGRGRLPQQESQGDQETVSVTENIYCSVLNSSQKSRSKGNMPLSFHLAFVADDVI